MEQRTVQLEHLRFIIDRYDHYYDTVNSKGQFYLAANTFLLGAFGAAYMLVHSKNLNSSLFTVSVCILASINWLSIFLTLTAILPYSGKVKRSKHPSLTFYGSVASQKYKAFLQQISAADDKAIEEDLSRQTHQLAKGLDYKFGLLKKAGYILALQFVLLLPFALLFFYII